MGLAEGGPVQHLLDCSVGLEDDGVQDDHGYLTASEMGKREELCLK